MIPPLRVEQIRAVTIAKAETHPELRKPLTLAGARRICVREGVLLRECPYPRIAQLLPALGQWTLVVDVGVPMNQRAVCIAHELGHLWLHHDPLFPRHETAIYDQSPPWWADVQEAEADALAEMLLRGPVVSPAPAADAATPREQAREQRIRSALRLVCLNSLNGPLGALRQRPPKDVSADGRRLIFDRDAEAMSFRARDGRTWHVMDFQGDGSSRIRLRYESDDATVREFRSFNRLERRVYRFLPGESRDMAFPDVDRQFAAAVDERARMPMAGD